MSWWTRPGEIPKAVASWRMDMVTLDGRCLVSNRWDVDISANDERHINRGESHELKDSLPGGASEKA